MSGLLTLPTLCNYGKTRLKALRLFKEQIICNNRSDKQNFTETVKDKSTVIKLGKKS